MDKRGKSFIENEIRKDYMYVNELHECYLGYSPRRREFIVGYDGSYTTDPTSSSSHQAGTIVVFNDNWQPQRMDRETYGNFYKTMYPKLKSKFPGIIDLRLS